MNSKADAEIQAMREEFTQKAKDDAERIRQNAKRSINDEFELAKRSFQQEVVSLAMNVAHDKLQKGIKRDDHRRLSQDFVQAVNRGQHG